MKKLAALIFLCISSLGWGKNCELLISQEEIQQKLSEVAAKIEEDFKGEEIILLMVMKGAVCVTADLIRHLNLPCTLEYMKASSYGQKGTKRGELTFTGLDRLDLKGKNVLVVDDIFDSGHTMKGIVDKVQEMQPKTLKTFVAVSKKVERDISYRPDYILFEIENRFVIGYGLDYKEYFRGLPGIYAFINDTPPQL